MFNTNDFKIYIRKHKYNAGPATVSLKVHKGQRKSLLIVFNKEAASKYLGVKDVSVRFLYSEAQNLLWLNKTAKKADMIETYAIRRGTSGYYVAIGIPLGLSDRNKELWKYAEENYKVEVEQNGKHLYLRFVQDADWNV